MKIWDNNNNPTPTTRLPDTREYNSKVCGAPACKKVLLTFLQLLVRAKIISECSVCKEAMTNWRYGVACKRHDMYH